VFISHSDCEEDAIKLAGIIRDEVDVREIETVTLGPVIGAHVGPGAVVLVYEADMTREEYEKLYYSK
jgi:fatty acid-binding protein DegV